MPIKYKYTPEMLAAAAVISLSIADVLRHLGITLAGGNHTHISRQLKHFGIDTSHFLGQAHYRGQRSARRLSPNQVLRVRPPGSQRTKPPTLRRALQEVGVPYRCGGCKIEGTWEGGPLTLHVDHINGDWLDNRINNLRFLCPNCHSQTENFAGKNRGVVAQRQEAASLGGAQSGFESRRPHKRLKSHAIDLKPISTNVTISSQDVFFIEYYLDQKRAKSRSAVIRKAIQLLRESTVEEDYAAAFGEMGEREEAKPPDSTVKDGIGDPV
jgi:Arc/MetJ-type ribon-helix-helix transcriptional regulator